MKLWYDKPARFWHEALPIGNGRMGGMVHGGITRELIQLNEDSVWSGKHLNRINPDAKENLPVIRKLIREGRVEEAQRLAMYALSGVPNSQRSYQTAGECCLQMHHGDEVQDYRRELELAEGISRVAYTVQGVRYIRESYVSYPENCMVMVLRTEDGTAFSFDCLLGRCHNATDEVEKVDEHTICFTVDGGQEGYPLLRRFARRQWAVSCVSSENTCL